MKTIFVTLPIGLTVRNLLFTGVLNKVISQGDVRVVAFTPVLDLADRYSETEDHLIFEPLPPRNRYRLTGLLNHILNFRFKRLIDDPSLTSLRLKRRWLREVRPKQWLFESILAQPFPKSRLIYRILSAVHDRRLGVSKEIPKLFDQYKPSMMFATNPTVMFEHDFLKFAKRTGVPTVGMIHSWDDLTTEGRIVVPVDRYFVWNELMKGELIKLHGASEEQISVTGIPQFDPYADVLSPCDKEQFLIGQDLDPGKLTVLFATSAGGDTPEEPEILELMVLALNKAHSGDIQFLVRVHRRDDVGRYAAINQPNVRFQVPGAQIAHLDDQRLMEQSDLLLLRDTLSFTDVLVNTASTISIDAAALDKPVVNIKFDLHEKDYIHSVRRYFDMVHYKPFIGSQATKIATSFDEMLAFIQRYLKDPTLEREQRANLAETMCYKVDGKSAERIASFLLAALDSELSNPEATTAG